MRLAPAVSLALALALALAAQGQELEQRAWSAEGARTATQDLQDVSASLQSTLDRSGTGTRSDALRSELDRFTQEAEALLLAVESGKSRDEVRPLYKQLRASRLALAEQARLSGFSVSQADVDTFQAVFEELETYFRQ